MKKFLFCISGIILTACASTQATPAQIPPSSEIQSIQEVTMSFEISSPAFANGEAIPSDFSCDGRDIPPALMWTEPPAGTQSFALVMDDPDAPIGTWVHWVLYDLPAGARELAANVPKSEER